MVMQQRLDTKEWMDLGNYTPEEYNDCLHQLDKVGYLLGGDSATFWAFNKLQQEPQSILDVGCGGGTLAIQLAKRYPQANVVGIDIAPEAIDYANRQLIEKYPHIRNVEFVRTASPKLEYESKSFDVVTSTLVCHHLTDTEIVQFLKEASRIARKAVILNDLHRHPLAVLAFKTVAPVLFPNPMVIHDGAISIRRAFKRSDWDAYFQAAGIPQTKVLLSWRWAFRWIAFIDTEHTDG